MSREVLQKALDALESDGNAMIEVGGELVFKTDFAIKAIRVALAAPQAAPSVRICATETDLQVCAFPGKWQSFPVPVMLDVVDGELYVWAQK
jgi:tagatose-1,6-bisphosphate aldolase non-catalytic subunit AgaZ/GatZ